MKLNFTRYAPPGFPLVSERNTFLLGIGLALLYSFGFLFRFYENINSLYEYIGRKRVLIPNAVMPDFVQILSDALIGFGIVGIGMLLFIGIHYLYHYQHSKSIYLMRRLPDRFELHRRCLTLPLLAAFACIIILLLVLFLYFAIYMLTTPKGCLAPNQFEKIWRVLL